MVFETVVVGLLRVIVDLLPMISDHLPMVVGRVLVIVGVHGLVADRQITLVARGFLAEGIRPLEQKVSLLY